MLDDKQALELATVLLQKVGEENQGSSNKRSNAATFARASQRI